MKMATACYRNVILQDYIPLGDGNIQNSSWVENMNNLVKCCDNGSAYYLQNGNKYSGAMAVLDDKYFPQYKNFKWSYNILNSSTIKPEIKQNKKVASITRNLMIDHANAIKTLLEAFEGYIKTQLEDNSASISFTFTSHRCGQTGTVGNSRHFYGGAYDLSVFYGGQEINEVFYEFVYNNYWTKMTRGQLFFEVDSSTIAKACNVQKSALTVSHVDKFFNMMKNNENCNVCDWVHIVTQPISNGACGMILNTPSDTGSTHKRGGNDQLIKWCNDKFYTKRFVKNNKK